MLLLAALLATLGFAAAAGAATAPTFLRTDYATGLAPTWAEPADVNADGKVDVVVTNGDSDTLSVLLGNGSGGFTAATSFLSGGDGPFGVAIADFTGDGRVDLAVVHRYSSSLSLLAGDGSGGFTLHSSAAVGLDPISLKVADLNEDGKRDLLIANMESAFLTAMLGNGTGGFTRRDIPLARKGGTNVGIADADGDGHLDVAVGHFFHNNVSVLHGDGTGGFTLARTLTVGTYPLGTAWADVDVDGDLDLCVSSRSPSVAQADQVSVFPGDGAGGLAAPANYVVGWFAKVVLAQDLNLDGIVDLGHEQLLGQQPLDPRRPRRRQLRRAGHAQRRALAARRGHGRLQRRRQGRPRGAELRRQHRERAAANTTPFAHARYHPAGHDQYGRQRLAPRGGDGDAECDRRPERRSLHPLPRRRRRLADRHQLPGLWRRRPRYRLLLGRQRRQQGGRQERPGQDRRHGAGHDLVRGQRLAPRGGDGGIASRRRTERRVLHALPCRRRRLAERHELSCRWRRRPRYPSSTRSTTPATRRP